jgi:hypothetical protein
MRIPSRCSARPTIFALACLAVLSAFLFSGHAFAQNTSGNVCLANVTQINPLLPEADMSGIVYFNGNYVAVSLNGVVMSSPDGTHWTQTTLPGSPTLNCLAANGTMLLAAGNTSFRSTDGVHWSAGGAISTLGNNLNAITWTGNMWLAVGDDTEIDTSPDGVHWTDQLKFVITPTPAMKAVVAAGSVFVAAGTNGTIVTGTNLQNWNMTGSPAFGLTTILTGLAYDPDPGHQILVAVSNNGTIFTSPDQGTTWSVVAGAPVEGWRNIRWLEGPGLFIAVGVGQTIATSPDGLHWTLARTTSAPADAGVIYPLADVAISSNGTQAVAVGNGTTIFPTSDFGNWTQLYVGVYPNLNGFGFYGNFTAIASDGNLNIVEVGTDPESKYDCIAAFSKDGGMTFSPTIMPPVNEAGTHPPNQTFNPNAVAYSPKLGAFVAVGQDNSVEMSTDGGFSWQIVLQYNVKNNEDAPFNGIVWTGNYFVAVGNYLNSPSDFSLGPIQYSSDGIHWTSTGGVSMQNMNAVATNGAGEVAAVGAGGQITFTGNINFTFIFNNSPTIQWAGEQMSGQPNFSGVAYGNGTWVAVGANGTVFSAIDSINSDGILPWIAQSLGNVTTNLNSVIFAGGFFFAFGADGFIYQSTNGSAWNRCAGPEAPGIGLKSATVTSLGLTILSSASNTFLGQIIPPATPSITAQPGNQTTISGQNTTFSASASGSPTPALQWQVSTDGVTWSNLTDNATYSGSATANLTVSGPTLLFSAAQYRLLASNSLGATPSSPAILTVDPRIPAFTASPANLTVNSGQSAQFSVAANGDPVPAYQWQGSTDSGITWSNLTDNSTYSGSATASLTVSNTTFALNNAQFRALALNTGGTTSSSPATLTVQTLPAILTPPGNQTVSVGQTAAFSVTASGNPVPVFQWQVSSDGGLSWANLTDGFGISGSTSANLTIANTILAMSQREFRAVLANIVGSVTSNAGILTVLSKPAITTLTGNQTGIARGNVTFSVNAGGSPPLKYQWQFNGRNISGATNSTYTIVGVKTTNAGKYDVVITNPSGHLTSTIIVVKVLVPPTVATLPKTLTVRTGGRASFTVHATGTLPFTYQWKFFGGNVTALNATGATTATLILTKVTSANAGPYLVVVTNSAGSVPSSSVTLTVK